MFKKQKYHAKVHYLYLNEPATHHVTYTKREQIGKFIAFYTTDGVVEFNEDFIVSIETIELKEK